MKQRRQRFRPDTTATVDWSFTRVPATSGNLGTLAVVAFQHLPPHRNLHFPRASIADVRHTTTRLVCSRWRSKD
jgi:hypothetical protein